MNAIIIIIIFFFEVTFWIIGSNYKLWPTLTVPYGVYYYLKLVGVYVGIMSIIFNGEKNKAPLNGCPVRFLCKNVLRLNWPPFFAGDTRQDDTLCGSWKRTLH